ncbi:hypothetical protein [Paraglaciecola sp. L3A3]|uniref:hypothetical protein n=1 Tax=Paraglaciecola sp. L3A3 TaxID=2686358 RepID=UPI00131BCB1C|nr:hypothetical protein [Paraglaciecola sp. L3A3]
MTKSNNPKKLIPANVRVMIALVSSPTLMVIGMLFYTLFTDGWQSVSIPMLIFSAIGALCYYMVITGKLPKRG